MKSIQEQRLHNSPISLKTKINKFRIPVIAYNTLVGQEDSIRIQISPNRANKDQSATSKSTQRGRSPSVEQSSPTILGRSGCSSPRNHQESQTIQPFSLPFAALPSHFQMTVCGTMQHTELKRNLFTLGPPQQIQELKFPGEHLQSFQPSKLKPTQRFKRAKKSSYLVSRASIDEKLKSGDYYDGTFTSTMTQQSNDHAINTFNLQESLYIKQVAPQQESLFSVQKPQTVNHSQRRPQNQRKIENMQILCPWMRSQNGFEVGCTGVITDQNCSFQSTLKKNASQMRSKLENLLQVETNQVQKKKSKVPVIIQNKKSIEGQNINSYMLEGVRNISNILMTSERSGGADNSQRELMKTEDNQDFNSIQIKIKHSKATTLPSPLFTGQVNLETNESVLINEENSPFLAQNQINKNREKTPLLNYDQNTRCCSILKPRKFYTKGSFRFKKQSEYFLQQQANQVFQSSTISVTSPDSNGVEKIENFQKAQKRYRSIEEFNEKIVDQKLHPKLLLGIDPQISINTSSVQRNSNPTNNNGITSRKQQQRITLKQTTLDMEQLGQEAQVNKAQLSPKSNSKRSKLAQQWMQKFEQPYKRNQLATDVGVNVSTDGGRKSDSRTYENASITSDDQNVRHSQRKNQRHFQLEITEPAQIIARQTSEPNFKSLFDSKQLQIAQEQVQPDVVTLVNMNTNIQDKTGASSISHQETPQNSQKNLVVQPIITNEMEIQENVLQFSENLQRQIQTSEGEKRSKLRTYVQSKITSENRNICGSKALETDYNISTMREQPLRSFTNSQKMTELARQFNPIGISITANNIPVLLPQTQTQNGIVTEIKSQVQAMLLHNKKVESIKWAIEKIKREQKQIDLQVDSSVQKCYQPVHLFEKKGGVQSFLHYKQKQEQKKRAKTVDLLNNNGDQLAKWVLQSINLNTTK